MVPISVHQCGLIPGLILSGVLLVDVGHFASLKLPCLQVLLVQLLYVNVHEPENVFFLPPTFTETSWAVTLLFTKLTGQQVSSGAIKRIWFLLLSFIS